MEGDSEYRSSELDEEEGEAGDTGVFDPALVLENEETAAFCALFFSLARLEGRTRRVS